MRTLIVGASDAGVALALELEGRTFGDSIVVGFVDDDVQLVGRSVRALRVLGTTHDLEAVCRTRARRPGRHRAARRVTRTTRRDRGPRAEDRRAGEGALRAVRLRTANRCSTASATSTSPTFSVASTRRSTRATSPTTSKARPCSSRAPAVRSAARWPARSRSTGPAALLLLDRDDSLLFEVVASLDKAEPILADIRDENRLREIFDRHEPDVVFHAAAHKHVPILESHPAEAVQTNVLGTWTLAQVAADHRCRLVHISTDKAADPCSVMGASKRVAELAVLSIGNEHALPFAAVRFGNVLGSRGSVVPDLLPPDRRGRTGHGHRPRDDALLHDDPRGRQPRAAGRRDGRQAQGVRARDGPARSRSSSSRAR